MKLLIFSDNHRDRESVKKMISENKNIDRIISLGDSEMPEPELSNLNIIGVKGNYPFEPKFPFDLLFNFEGINVFFTHGHKYHVKLGISRLVQKAYQTNAQVVCFGHTHSTYLKEINDVIYLNPGSLAKPRMGYMSTYAILEITERIIDVKIFSLSDKLVIKEYNKSR